MFYRNYIVNIRRLHCRNYKFKLRQSSAVSKGYCTGIATSEKISSWESVVGLEIHAQINAKSKLFSSSSSIFNAPTNTQVSYFDAALPGCLPVLNKYCVEAGVLTALALNCTINKISAFDRKHYFYPDLPAGYQITQQFYPLAQNGIINFNVYDIHQRKVCYTCSAYLKQLQLEQDSGRSFHVENQRSLVDLNRAGIGLMELVFEPTLKNGMEAAGLVSELILILRSLGVCTCEMEEGALRVDANVSVNHPGEGFGVRTEVKNINSVRYISRAIDYEIERQIKVLEEGGVVTNETRAYDYRLKKTLFMRDKETLQDYRFMPEPNLPPIRLCDDDDGDLKDDENCVNISRLKEKLPDLPFTLRTSLIEKYHITKEDADKLVSIQGLRLIFEEVALYVEDKKEIMSFLLSRVQHELNARKLSFVTCPVTAKQIASIINLIVSRTITVPIATDILEMLCNGDSRIPEKIVEEYNWYQILEGKELDKLCHQVMHDRSKMVSKFKKSGKQRYLQSLMKGLEEISNNRASYEDGQKTFLRLMGKTSLDKESKSDDSCKK